MKLIKKFNVLLIGESILIKYLKNPIYDYPDLLFASKRNLYNEDNSLGNSHEGL